MVGYKRGLLSLYMCGVVISSLSRGKCALCFSRVIFDPEGNYPLENGSWKFLEYDYIFICLS